MKKIFLLMTAVIAAMSLSAAPVDQSAAMQKAQDYLRNNPHAGNLMAPVSVRPILVKTEIGDTKLNQPVYYIYNTTTTFLVISGDDRALDVLMVGDQPLDINNMPDGLQFLLDCYKEQIEYLQKNPNLVVEKREANMSLRATTYGPLLQSTWDQSAPYNNQCKFTYNNRTYNCATGCPATSAAMVMHYWKYPEGVPAMASYTGYLDINTDPYSNETNYVSFTYPSLPATTFDWANMKNSYSGYSGYTTTQGNAVATLMRYIGQAEHMEYGYKGSGISTANAGIIATMFKNWGYKSSAKLVYKTSYSNNNWINLIKNEMAASRPVVYLGVDRDYGGHAFNVDGYRDSDGLFHVNFGWSGSGNNWFAMNAFTDPDGATFNLSQMAVIGIEAPNGMVQVPELSVSPTSLTFTGDHHKTYTQTFTVTGSNLKSDVRLSVSSTSGYYSVSPTTIPAAEAAAGATVTVTYSPEAAGSTTGTVTVETDGAESQTVSLKGTAAATPLITVDPESMSFTSTVGTPVSQTFYLKGYSLNRMVTMTVTGPFTLSQNQALTSAANAGLNITVTYKPTTMGTQTGSITVSSSGAETVTIPLTGTATVTTYTPVMLPAAEQYINLTTFRAEWTDETAQDAVSSYTLNVTPKAGGAGRTITDITDKFCAVENLTAAGTFLYKVKAIYIDGTESAWSNTQEVTLFEQGHGYVKGDVNHDTAFNVSDVVALITAVSLNSSDVCQICADYNEDGEVNVSDIIAMISAIQGGN